MFDQQLRNSTKRLLAPIAKITVGWLSPYQLTAIGGLVGVAAALAASQSWWMLALGLWLVNRFLDGLDGAVARISRRSSDAGGYVDITVDMVVYGSIPLGVGFGHGTATVWAATAVLLASFYVNTITWTYLSAVLEKQGLGASSTGEPTTVTMPVGLVEGAETILFFVLILALPTLAAPIMVIMAALVIVGAAIRFVAGHNQIKTGLNSEVSAR